MSDLDAFYVSLITLHPLTKKKQRITTAEIYESIKTQNFEREPMLRRIRRQANNQVEIPPISRLPKKILVNILSRLATRTILACASVCNSWEKVIFTDPEFAKLQFLRSATQEVMVRPDGPGSFSRKAFLVDLADRYSKVYVELTLPLNDELSWSGIDIVSTCNGLVCLCTFLDRNPVAVWNPLTREYVNIPRHDPVKVRRSTNPIGCECSLCLEYDEIESEESVVASGFGCSLRGEQYKVVRVLGKRKLAGRHCSGGVLDSFTRVAEVYTLGETNWRKTNGLAPQTTHSMSSGTYLKGKFYWVCSNEDGEFEFVASFEFDDEQFGLTLLPPGFKAARKCTSEIRLQELGGHVSLCDFSSANHFDIWMMEEVVPGRVYWTKALVVHMWHGDVVEPLKILNKEEILLMQDSRAFVAYNCASMRLVGRLELDATRSCYGAIAYVPSFLSLTNIVKGDGQIEVLRINQTVKVKP